MPTRALCYIVEMITPAGFKSDITRAALEDRIQQAYPNCAIRVMSYNRSVAMLDHHARRHDAKPGFQGTPLKVPYEQNPDARRLGARWDKDKRVWIAPPGIDLQPFRDRGWLV